MNLIKLISHSRKLKITLSVCLFIFSIGSNGQDSIDKSIEINNSNELVIIEVGKTELDSPIENDSISSGFAFKFNKFFNSGKKRLQEIFKSKKNKSINESEILKENKNLDKNIPPSANQTMELDSVDYSKKSKFKDVPLNIYSAAKDFERYNYVNAQKSYVKFAESGDESIEVVKSLADTYYFNSQYDKAAVWYNKLLTNYSDQISAEYYFKASLSLKSLGDYKGADYIMSEYIKRTDKIIIRNEFNSNQQYLDTIEKNSNLYSISKTSINSSKSDFGPSYYGSSQVVFASANKGSGSEDYTWTGEPFLDLHIADIDVNGDLVNNTPFNGGINTKFHESSTTFTKDLKTMYFTRNNYFKGEEKWDDENTIKLKLYRASMQDDDSWGNIEELPFNSDQYSVAHPSLSLDEKRIYFSSDMPGTFGKSDIWYVDIIDKENYGRPVNLGPNINTEERESFPYISSENVLYFSSNGLMGLGGLDIFMTALNSKGFPTSTTNLGEPVNSRYDDFGLIINPEINRGYLSSNRDGFDGSSSDEIYTFFEDICLVSLAGVVTDIRTGDLIPGSKVQLIGEDLEVIAEQIVGEDARYNFKKDIIDCSILYRITAGNGKAYKPASKDLTTPSISQDIIVDLALDWATECAPNDLGCILELKPLYFDFDKSFIRTDAAVELQKVLEAMNEYPEMIISFESHTDSRGNDIYNENLSERRAKSTRGWLLDRGISPDRLTAKGFGESQLLNQCANGVRCSEEEHQQNRRSFFRIIYMNDKFNIDASGTGATLKKIDDN
ncbi:MAG: outer membrane protein OmpA-like peptidoglycan-associated protein [Flavobacteriaceae bacterium]|jgi:outer membrane protein OmpA-like peptidoglycan-associated protein